jgi:hypothetical protein
MSALDFDIFLRGPRGLDDDEIDDEGYDLEDEEDLYDDDDLDEDDDDFEDDDLYEDDDDDF